ncbi:16280_t:CDS:2, partial [Gigaspora rosea]
MNSLSMPNYDNGHDNNYDNECSNDYNDYGNDYGNEYDNNYDNNYNDLGNDLGNEHDNDHENDNVSTTSKRSNGSEVWDFFKKVVWQKEKKTAKCSVLKCPHKEFSCGHGGSTRTLWRHLEDLWTSPNNKAFASVTAHYIDDNWTLQEILIDFGLLSGRHDRTNISNGFFRVLDDYNIISK